MAVLPLVTGIDNKILRTKSKPVKVIDRKIKKLIKDMTETMIHADGLGLAAPQIGVNLRIYIARLNFNTQHEMIVPMVNAEMLKISKETSHNEEGCLSIPKRFGIVKRANDVTVRYMNERGTINTLNLTGLNARIMQHETDHLNAILIADKWEREVDVAARKEKESQKTLLDH